ncbi:MAG: FecR domain-containing protein [Gammaproteobacteria bacterium]|jgi:tetratricopeptide (TPR) repeat protein
MTIDRVIPFAICLSWVLGLVASPVLAADSCDVTVGRLATLEGQVEIQPTGMASWRPGALDAELCQGDTVRAGERSRATVVLLNQAVLRIDQNTAMRLDKVSGVAEERSALSLFKGALQSFSRKPRGFEVSTPYLNGSIEGTEFVFRVTDTESTLTVLEGVVIASNDQGSASVSGGEAVAAAAGQAPQKYTVVRPRDAVQWSLYYPPILAVGGDGEAGISPVLRRAASDLSVGRVAEARAKVDQAIADNEGAGLAYALRAVIEVVQNQREQALVDARQGVSRSPDSAAAAIALSYALQANFEINEARDVLQRAVVQHPDDALARARLAELQLMLGDREQATATAQQAVALEPDLGRTQITLGFAALAEFRNDAAAAAFEKAIALDSADPLPHLGLGLARISAGHLEAGRSELELAVGLDSSSSLLRSYLGKAYFEEKRAPLDAQQFEIAKQLDPKDPTPWLYSGIAKQTVNQPVEAARDLEKSIELNDNRAAYRGRLLLDKDRAARGVSHARIYNDLGFARLGINSAVDSVTVDPANASAHRYLSDAYLTTPRHETARVSELQQAQMLQDININPIQPSLSDTNLNIVTLGGPAEAGFNEFTPLFERNEARADVTGFYGSNNTKGGEAVVSGLYNWLSLSAGAFGYDTDGYRSNNDLKHEIYNFYTQVAATPALNLQFEYQKRNSDFGDLDMNFDPDAFSENERNSLDTESERVGARFSLAPNADLLLLYNHKDVDSRQKDESLVGSLPSPPFPPGLDIFQNDDFHTDIDSDQYEGAYIYEAVSFNILAGAAATKADRNDKFTVNIIDPLAGTIPLADEDIDNDIKDKRAYVYGNINLPQDITWTLGVSQEKYDDDVYDLNKTNPKIGVKWDVDDSLSLRAAWFKVMKPVLASNRTLEPTQVAGFNQFFDDVDASRSTRYGLGVDWAPTRALSMGAEGTRREVRKPVNESVSSVEFEDLDEWTNRAYLYWTPTDDWALSLDAVYDKFKNDDNSLNANFVPRSVRTYTVPAKLLYFNPKGYFGGLGLTYVDQKVSRTSASGLPEGKSDFSIVDLSVGYRLPKRSGVISLAVHNLLDKDFNYQDDSYREFGDEPSVAPYIPERVVMGRFTLNF